MAKRPTVSTISSGYASNTQLNSNFTAIRDAFDNTLSLDGSMPNAMTADLDLNGNALLNVGTVDTTNLTLNGQTVTDLSSVPEWRSAWLTGTSYVKNDLVSEAGSSYICLVAHTAGTFSTDLTALKWELFAQKGAAGAGTGDMLAANNLSDVTNVATSRTNLGLGTVATENTVPVAKGGTGATDAATARTNLGLGSLATASSITTTEIAAATLVTASETIASNNNDTTIPTSAAVKAYADTRSPIPDAVLEDRKASGTNGQTVASAGTWTTKELQTEVRDPDGIVSISSNQFTVTVDGYCEWVTIGRDAHLTRLYNVTDAAAVANSTSCGSGLNIPTMGEGALIAGKTYRIEVNTGTAGQIHGQPAGRGMNECYTRVKIWRA